MVFFSFQLICDNAILRKITTSFDFEKLNNYKKYEKLSKCMQQLLLGCKMMPKIMQNNKIYINLYNLKKQTKNNIIDLVINQLCLVL